MEQQCHMGAQLSSSQWVTLSADCALEGNANGSIVLIHSFSIKYSNERITGTQKYSILYIAKAMYNTISNIFI